MVHKTWRCGETDACSWRVTTKVHYLDPLAANITPPPTRLPQQRTAQLLGMAHTSSRSRGNVAKAPRRFKFEIKVKFIGTLKQSDELIRFRSMISSSSTSPAVAIAHYWAFNHCEELSSSSSAVQAVMDVNGQ